MLLLERWVDTGFLLYTWYGYHIYVIRLGFKEKHRYL